MYFKHERFIIQNSIYKIIQICYILYNKNIVPLIQFREADKVFRRKYRKLFKNQIISHTLYLLLQVITRSLKK